VNCAGQLTTASTASLPKIASATIAAAPVMPAQYGRCDDKVRRGQWLAAVQNGVPHSPNESLVGMRDVSTDHQDIRIQQADCRRSHIADCPTGSRDNPHGLRITFSHKINNVTGGKWQAAEAAQVTDDED
jgi:hypothetical protein